METPVFCFFSHGIADTGDQAYHYAPEIISFPIHTFNYDDARSYCKKIPKVSQVSLAQENEILCFVRAFDQFEYELQQIYGDNYQIVLYGLSRGASVILMFLALYPEKTSHISACILESPFDSVSTILQELITRPLFSHISLDYAHTLLENIFRKYTRSYPAPIKLLTHIPRQIPILIACSKKDTLVPFKSSLAIYEKLRLMNHQKVEIFVAETSNHAKIIDGLDAKNYSNAIDNFFKKYTHLNLSKNTD